MIKRVNGDMQQTTDIRMKVNNYLQLDVPYDGRDDGAALSGSPARRSRLGRRGQAKVKNPLKGKKIGAYYGCLLLRPSQEMQFDDPENPTILEDFIRAIGAEPGLLRHAQRVLRRLYDD